jgi:hypothetical protein
MPPKNESVTHQFECLTLIPNSGGRRGWACVRQRGRGRGREGVGRDEREGRDIKESQKSQFEELKKISRHTGMGHAHRGRRQRGGRVEGHRERELGTYITRTSICSSSLALVNGKPHPSLRFGKPSYCTLFTDYSAYKTTCVSTQYNKGNNVRKWKQQLVRVASC